MTARPTVFPIRLLRSCLLPLLAVLAVFVPRTLSAQVPLQPDTLRLTVAEAEERFLKENLLLLAARLDLDIREALVRQARLWPNPELEINELNFWATERQLSLGEELPPWTGNFGRNRQLSAQVEQLVLTAGKRRKLVAIAELDKSIAGQYFEELLKGLRYELRHQLMVLQYHQAYADMLRTHAGFVATLVESYERQYERGNVSRTELFRLRALDLELREQVLEVEREAAYRQMELRSLLGIPAAIWLVVTPVALPEAERIATLDLAALTASARTNRPDVRISTLATEQAHARLSYERAEAVPNVSLFGGYDRGGNFLLNFIGFGAAFEVPVFNRNQGNIQAARLEARQQELLQRYLEERVDNEVLTAYGQVLAQSGFFRSIAAEYEGDLDELMDNVNRNFRLRNISLLEYLDFFEAYRENKETLLQASKDLYLLWEELKLVTGTELD